MSDGPSRVESVLWALVLLVGPIGLIWEFGGSLLDTLPLSQSLPIRYIHHIEVAMYTLVIVLGGGTLLAFIYAATRFSDGVVDAPTAMPTGWGQRRFIAWIAVVVAVLMVTATVGATTLMTVDSGPAAPASQGNDIQTEGSLTYRVVGVQWTWMVKPKPNHLGFAMRRVIHIPANTTIHLEITSKDVIHSFAIQKLGVKKDAVPGQLNHYWFVARDPGEYQINCAELCGAGHSRMVPTLDVMTRDRYGEWVVEQGGDNPFTAANEAAPATNASAGPAGDSTAQPTTATAANATTTASQTTMSTTPLGRHGIERTHTAGTRPVPVERRAGDAR